MQTSVFIPSAVLPNLRQQDNANWSSTPSVGRQPQAVRYFTKADQQYKPVAEVIANLSTTENSTVLLSTATYLTSTYVPQVVSAQLNISNRYSTECEMQRLQEISAIDERLRDCKQTFVVYMNFHVCIMYVSCMYRVLIHTNRYMKLCFNT